MTLPADTLLPPLPDKNLIAENETFWTQAAARAFAPIERAAAPPDPNAPRSWGERLLDKFHVPREPDQMAVLAGLYYSRSLDFWGVELQRAGELDEAAAHFDTALKLNPDNVVAQINLRLQPNPPRRQRGGGGSVQSHHRPVRQIPDVERSPERQRAVRRTELLF